MIGHFDLGFADVFWSESAEVKGSVMENNAIILDQSWSSKALCECDAWIMKALFCRSGSSFSEIDSVRGESIKDRFWQLKRDFGTTIDYFQIHKLTDANLTIF